MPVTPPSSPRSAPVEALAEDFLYHLYRGSSLLAEGRFDGAREELDRALRTQPHDPAAQDLLAKLYFRLGVYPRAIELYADIVRQFPDRIPPRINLALAYLKTGQMRDVVSQLLPVVESDASHSRAWGYLGLAWSRLGEYAKAREAFERAGHPGMVRRMDEALEAQYGGPRAGGGEGEGAPADAGETLRRVAEVAFDEADMAALESGGLAVADASIAPSPGQWTAREPGGGLAGEFLRSNAVTLGEFARRAALAPRGGALEIDGGALVVVGGCAARIDAATLGVGFERGDEVRRRGADGGLFSGSPRLAWIRSGWCVVPPRPGAARAVLTLRDDEALVVAERSLAAFEATLHYENAALLLGEDALRVASFVGRGRVALEVSGTLRAIAAQPSAPVALPRAALVAWTSGLTVAHDPRGGAATPFVQLAGEGVVVASLGETVDG